MVRKEIFDWPRCHPSIRFHDGIIPSIRQNKIAPSGIRMNGLRPDEFLTLPQMHTRQTVKRLLSLINVSSFILLVNDESEDFKRNKWRLSCWVQSGATLEITRLHFHVFLLLILTQSLCHSHSNSSISRIRESFIQPSALIQYNYGEYDQR